MTRPSRQHPTLSAGATICGTAATRRELLCRAMRQRAHACTCFTVTVYCHAGFSGCNNVFCRQTTIANSTVNRTYIWVNSTHRLKVAH
eukprot:238029-Chlamydomonas_euryale.AAC.6